MQQIYLSTVNILSFIIIKKLMFKIVLEIRKFKVLGSSF